MGLSHFGSSSTYDSGAYCCPSCSKGTIKTEVIVKGNPNPKKFEVLGEFSYRGWLILKVRYPDAKNYEGVKILVYKGVGSVKELLHVNGGTIDPHFSDSKTHYSPFARFEPTDQGMTTAMCLVNAFS